MKRARLDMRLSESDKKMWTDEADRRGLDVSEFVRRSVTHYVSQNPKPRKVRPGRTKVRQTA